MPEKGTGGFAEGLIESTEGEKVTVQIKGGEKKVFKKDLVGQVNPPKFDCCEDMSNLTYLNDASVFWNLKVRYINELIYTYSGLFCIAVNPYKVNNLIKNVSSFTSHKKTVKLWDSGILDFIFLAHSFMNRFR